MLGTAHGTLPRPCAVFIVAGQNISATRQYPIGNIVFQGGLLRIGGSRFDRVIRTPSRFDSFDACTSQLELESSD